MVPLDVLLPRILPSVLHCPRSMAVDAAQTVAVDFCKRTELWRDTLTESVASGQARIEFSLPREVRVARVMDVRLDGEALPPEAFEASSYGLTLRETPRQEATAHILAALRTARTADKLPDELVEEWGDALVWGVLAKLQAMSGAGIEWSDPQAAAANLALYEDGVAQARIQTIRRRHGDGPLHVGQGDIS